MMSLSLGLVYLRGNVQLRKRQRQVFSCHSIFNSITMYLTYKTFGGLWKIKTEHAVMPQCQVLNLIRDPDRIPGFQTHVFERRYTSRQHPVYELVAMGLIRFNSRLILARYVDIYINMHLVYFTEDLLANLHSSTLRDTAPLPCGEVQRNTDGNIPSNFIATVGPRPLGPRRNRRAAWASRQSF